VTPSKVAGFGEIETAFVSPVQQSQGRSDAIPSTAQRSARLVVLGFEPADHSLGLVVEGGDDLDGVLFRVVKSEAPTARSTSS
jgi:hypothetical protein